MRITLSTPLSLVVLTLLSSLLHVTSEIKSDLTKYKLSRFRFFVRPPKGRDHLLSVPGSCRLPWPISATNWNACLTAAPGQVILSKRVQELSATLGGVIQECTDGDTNFDGTADTDPDGTIDIATECIVTDEEIGLLQDTTAAHHFNFVLPNMDQGEYDIKAYFTTGARAEVDICDSELDYCGDLYDAEGTVSASATAKAVVNKTMLTVQQVRAAKGGVIDADISPM
jgi:hypothetical protein